MQKDIDTAREMHVTIYARDAKHLLMHPDDAYKLFYEIDNKLKSKFFINRATDLHYKWLRIIRSTDVDQGKWFLA